MLWLAREDVFELQAELAAKTRRNGQVAFTLDLHLPLRPYHHPARGHCSRNGQISSNCLW